MGDYLNNVAARVSSRAPAVRPRLPSLFEPPAAHASTRISALLSRAHREREDLRGVAEETEAPAPAAAATLASSVPAPPVRRLREMTPSQLSNEIRYAPGDRPDASIEASPQPSAAKSIHFLASKPLQEPREITPSNAGDPAVIVRPEPQGDHRQTAPPERNTVREIIQEAHREQPGPLVTPPTIEPTRAETVVVREFQTVERITPATSTQPNQITPQTISGLAQHITAPRPSPPPFVSEPAEPAPSVQVVIGCVTVQAVTPPAQPKPAPPRAQSPRLSLEEYLKQREARA
jgi:hypothetical protein